MWRIEYDPGQNLLTVWLREMVQGPELHGLSTAHAEALEATAGERFRVLLDLRGLYPLDTEAAALLADMKRVAVTQQGYLGRAVLVDSPTVAMQQRNATYEDGGDRSELITLEPEAAQRFIRGLLETA